MSRPREKVAEIVDRTLPAMAKTAGARATSVFRIWKAPALTAHRIETFRPSNGPDFAGRFAGVARFTSSIACVPPPEKICKNRQPWPPLRSYWPRRRFVSCSPNDMSPRFPRCQHCAFPPEPPSSASYTGATSQSGRMNSVHASRRRRISIFSMSNIICELAARTACACCIFAMEIRLAAAHRQITDAGRHKPQPQSNFAKNNPVRTALSLARKLMDEGTPTGCAAQCGAIFTFVISRLSALKLRKKPLIL